MVLQKAHLLLRKPIIVHLFRVKSCTVRRRLKGYSCCL